MSAALTVPRQGLLESGAEAPARPVPICHQVVDDVGRWVLFEHADGDTYAVGSVSVDRYLIVPAEKIDIVMRIIELLDGSHDLAAVQRRIAAEFGKQAQVAELFLKLRDAGLIKTAQMASKAPRSEILRHSVHLFTVMVAGVFSHLTGLRGLFSPLGLLLGASFSAYGFWVVEWGQVSAPSRQLLFGSYVLGYLAMWLSMLVLVVIHESFHGLAGLRYGLTPRSITAALYLGFIPYVFISIPGVYTIPPRQRLVLWSAGLYSNFLLGAALQILYPHLDPSSVAAQLVAKVMVANLMIIIFNLSPLMVTDSYFILSTLFKTPNVRTNAFQEFKKWVRREQHHFRGFLIVYFAFSLAMIIYCVDLLFRWLARVVMQVVEQGLSPANLTDLTPLLMIVVMISLRRVWKRKLAREAAAAETEAERMGEVPVLQE